MGAGWSMGEGSWVSIVLDLDLGEVTQAFFHFTKIQLTVYLCFMQSDAYCIRFLEHNFFET